MAQQKITPDELLDPGIIRGKVRSIMSSDSMTDVKPRDIKYLQTCIKQLWPAMQRISDTMIEPDTEDTKQNRMGLRILEIVDGGMKSELWIEWIRDPKHESMLAEEDDDEEDSIVDEDSPNYGGTTQIVEVYRATRTIQGRSEAEAIQKHGLKTFVNAIGAALDAKEAEIKRIAADSREGKAIVRQWIAGGRPSSV